MYVLPLVPILGAVAAPLSFRQVRKHADVASHRNGMAAIGRAVVRAKEAPSPSADASADFTDEQPHVRIVDTPKSRKRRQVPAARRRARERRRRMLQHGSETVALEVFPLAELVRRRGLE